MHFPRWTRHWVLAKGAKKSLRMEGRDIDSSLGNFCWNRLRCFQTEKFFEGNLYQLEKPALLYGMLIFWTAKGLLEILSIILHFSMVAMNTKASILDDLNCI